MAPLKDWMRKEDIYDNDLYDILRSYNVRDAPKDFKKITQPKWDEIWRRGKVERFKELKDQKSRNRLDKKMKKLEKVWRTQSGIKMTSITANKSNTKTKKKKKHKPNHKRQKKNKPQQKTKKKCKNNQLTQPSTKKKKTGSKQRPKKKKGQALKIWMQKNNCFELTLHSELLRKGIDSPESIKDLNENQFDKIVRNVRVDKFAQLKDQSARNRCDKLLVQFEKIWRKKSGHKKTNLKKYV